MLEDEDEQKYPFLLIFLHVCGLGGTLKYVSLADVRSAIFSDRHTTPRFRAGYRKKVLAVRSVQRRCSLC